MADDSLELIRLRNNFYRDNYRRVMKLLLIMSIVSVLLICAIFYLIAHRPTPKYFATTQSGRVLQLVPLSSPLLTTQNVLLWASQVAAASYTYNFASYQADISALEPYFTNDGWQQYLGAVKENLRTIEQNRMIVSAAAGTAIMAYQGMLSGSYAWKVQVPLRATFTTGSESFSRNYLITMTIIRVSTLENKNGIAIAQYIVEG